MTMRSHAVVVGASMAGLLAARALLDHYERVTIVVVEQRPGREQTGHARAHHDGVRAHRHHPAGARMAPTRPGTWSRETVVNVVGSDPVSRANVALPASGLGQ